MNNPAQLEGSEHDEVRTATTTSDSPRDGTLTTVERFAAQSQSRPVFHPIWEKLGNNHISQILKNSRPSERDEVQLQRSGRWFRITCASGIVLLVIFLTQTLLPEHSESYFRILQGIAIFFAGVAGGYGVRSCQGRNRA